MSILELFGWGKSEVRTSTDAAETESVRRIVRELDHMDPDRARFVAAFAYVLSRVAGADMQISDEETQVMERIVTEYGALSEKQSILVVQMAKSQNLLFGGTENFLVTRELNRIATYEQKKSILDCLFAVSAADDSVTTVEDTAIRQIADQLLLEHRDFIEARSKVREHLAVLKSKRPSGEADRS